ncbi:uncharacterized protein JCM15063_004013 [Sporobolomyces koalae]|uniref:uncharacterized protein n=1 Tax=Sporobolomyces koalae TaxID=500713 RepID=UPI003174BF05
MRADTNFATLCPELTIKQWCADPTGEVCCGICPNTGISGLGGHVSLAFSSLSSITAIALSPASAPTALTTNLIQANAYALVLLGYLLTNSKELDFFHAAYALLLAFSSLIPLTAIAASPPWAVTGQDSPQERSQAAESIVLAAMGGLESGGDSDDDDNEKAKRTLLRRRKRQLRRAIRDDPDLLVDALEDQEKRGICGIRGSHWMLYLGMTGSILLWSFALMTGILGGANGSTRVSLAQADCTKGLGNVASLIILTASYEPFSYCRLNLTPVLPISQDVGFMILAVAVAVAIVMNHLVKDLAGMFQRQSIMEYSGSPQLVFGASFTVWVVWMLASFALYFNAGNTILLSSMEFSWTFGTSKSRS